MTAFNSEMRAKPEPAAGKRRAGIAHLAERHLAKVEVASSNLVARSIKKHGVKPFFCLRLFGAIAKW